MQAGGGGRTKLSVVSFQFLVRSRQRLFVLGSASFRCDAKEVVSSQFLVKGGKRFFCGGLGKLRLGRKDGLGELFTAEVRRNAESSYGRPSTLSRGADEIPLAPGERFVHR
jgi:hypothetical protein